MCGAVDERGMIASKTVLVVLLLVAPVSATVGIAAALRDGTHTSLPDAASTTQGTAPATNPSPSFQLPRATYRAGESLHFSSTSHSILKTQIIEAGRTVQTFDQVEDKSAEKTIDVLAVDSEGPTKLRVTYSALQFLQQKLRDEGADPKLFDSESMNDVNPLEGRVFVLVRDGTEMRVLDGDEKPIDEGLAQLVRDEESVQRGRWSPAGRRLALELAGRAITLGATIDLSPETARAFVDGRADLDHVSMRLVARVTRSVSGVRCAVFDAHLDIQDKGGGESQATQIALAGEVFVDLATGRYIGAELKGKLMLGDSQHDLTNAVEVVGEGPWNISERYTTAAPK